MNSPFNYARQFPYSTEAKYFAGVITLPAKKLFKNVEYQNLTQQEQREVLIEIMKKIRYFKSNNPNFINDCNIKYYSFEYHPQRNKSKPCLHLNLMMEFNRKHDLYEHVVNMCFLRDIEKATGSTMINKICHCSLIKTKIDAFNWVNYIYKDYPEHFVQETDYIEDLIDDFHIQRYNERHKTSNIPNDLDYK